MASPASREEASKQMAIGTNLDIPTIKTQEFEQDQTLPNSIDLKAMLPIAERIAGKIAKTVPSHIAKEDLMAAARLGLTEAYAKYDPLQGNFLAYAEKRIRGAVLDELRKGDIIPRCMRTEISKQRKAGLRDDNGPQAQTLDTAHKATLSPHADKGLYEGLVTPAVQKEEINKGETERIIQKAIAELPERDRQIYQMYYVDELTFKEIGEKMGITPSRVNQLLSRARRRVKELLPGNLEI